MVNIICVYENKFIEMKPRITYISSHITPFP